MSSPALHPWSLATSAFSTFLLAILYIAPPAMAMPVPAGLTPSGEWTAAGPGIVARETGEPGEDFYIVLHQAPSLAQYRGEVAGLAPTSPAVTGAKRLDPGTPESVAYLAYLETRHNQLATAISAALGRPVPPEHRYDAVLNGIAVRMTADEAATVSHLAGVRKVARDEPRQLLTDNGPRWIGADAVWEEDPISGECAGDCGEGVVVGVIDTGINFDHPSFAAVGPIDGYAHSNPRPTFLGLCDPVTGLPFCNDKLIGFYDFTGEAGGPDDQNGHGSHTAGTAAGNIVDVVLEAATTTLVRRISGVAPHANIIAYKACGSEPVGLLGCFPTLVPLLAAINQATLDQVDVINYSIGGGSGNPWVDDDAQAFFDAYTAGIFVATSAGNSGPGVATLGSPADAPWVTAVGASTHDRILNNGLVNMTGGTNPPPADIFGKSLTGPLSAARVVYAGDFASSSSEPANAHLCGAGVGDPATGEGSGGAPWPPGTFNGEIVVCDRGEYGRVHKGENVKAAGAGGFILANDEANGNSLVGDPHVLPAVHISYDDGIVLKAWIAGGGAAHTGTGEIQGTVAGESSANADVMAGFSSRGFNPSVPDLIKPDVTAPGVDILAAFHSPAGTLPGADPEFGIISGTSMSSPHTAGAGALIIGARPDWTPDQVKSALMTTAFTTFPGTDTETHGVFKEDGFTPADPFDMGGGRIDLRQATEAGLIMEVGAAAYSAADPALSGDASTLNIASFGQDSCEGSCSWTRTVEATVDSAWLASTTAPAGMVLTVSPASFSLNAGETQTITVTADVSAVTPKNLWTFAEVQLTPSDTAVPMARFPVAVIPKIEGGEPTVVLHLHGNTHDTCDAGSYTGQGSADLTAGCDPYMSTDPELDTAPAAKWGPLTPVTNGTSPQNIYDPNWIWVLDEPTTLNGPMVLEWWAAGPLSNPVFNEAFNIRLYADGVLHVQEQVSHNITSPGVAQLLSSTVNVPQITANTSYVVQIDPVFIDSQEGSFVYYDSELGCTGGSEPCDSRIGMPVVTVGTQPPVANDDSAFTVNGGTVIIDVLANDFDPEGGPLVVNRDGLPGPSNGTADVTFSNTIRYTHDGSATLSDSFQYRITDNQGQSATATVFITVSAQCFQDGGSYFDDFESGAPGWSVDTAVLTAGTQTWMLQTDPLAQSGTTDWFTDALGNDGVADTSKDVRLVSPPNLVSPSSNLTFWHRFSTEAGFDGGVLEVSLDDGASWADIITAGGSFVSGGYNSIISSGDFVMGGRPAWTGDSPTYPVNNQVEVNIAALAGETLRFRFRFGQDVLLGHPGGWWIDDVAVSNLWEACPAAGPTAMDDSDTVAAGGSVNTDVKANDSDPDTPKANLMVEIITDADHGTTMVETDGSVTYTHNGNLATSDFYEYKVTDPEGNFDTAIVDITIVHDNQDPVAEDDTASVSESGSVTIPVQDNDFDPDGDELTVTLETTPQHGAAGITADGQITYTHNGDSATEDSFVYRLTDEHGAFDTATVTITIEQGPEPCREALCVDGDKPSELTLTFVGGTCADSDHSQGSKADCTDYASGAFGEVFIRATNKEDADYDNARVYFEGLVMEGEEFTLSAATADEDDLGSKVFLHLFAADGSLLQTVEIHTSCSAPLIEGEQFGALKLGDANAESDAPICSDGEGRVHGSGKLLGLTSSDGDDDSDSDSDSDSDFEKIDFSFDAKHKSGGLKGKLKVHDKELDVKIDAKSITSLTTGTGMDCGGLVLDGVNSFYFTAEGDFEFGDTETPATFAACGVDNGKNHDGEPADYFYAECLTGCLYNTGDRVPDNDIDGGNIHLHDPIVDPVQKAASAWAPDHHKHEAGARKLTSEIDVVTIEPALLSVAPAGAALVITAIVEAQDGLVATTGATLHWETDSGTTGQAAAVTNAYGIATFLVTVPEGEVRYWVAVDGLESNGLGISGL